MKQIYSDCLHMCEHSMDSICKDFELLVQEWHGIWEKKTSIPKRKFELWLKILPYKSVIQIFSGDKRLQLVVWTLLGLDSWTFWVFNPQMTWNLKLYFVHSEEKLIMTLKKSGFWLKILDIFSSSTVFWAIQALIMKNFSA